jgi:hypothetical protein
MPVIAVRAEGAAVPTDATTFASARSSLPLLLWSRFETDRRAIQQVLDRVDQSVDFVEPFARVREAIAEARKMGVTNRAA